MYYAGLNNNSFPMTWQKHMFGKIPSDCCQLAVLRIHSLVTQPDRQLASYFSKEWCIPSFVFILMCFSKQLVTAHALNMLLFEAMWNSLLFIFFLFSKPQHLNKKIFFVALIFSKVFLVIGQEYFHLKLNINSCI